MGPFVLASIVTTVLAIALVWRWLVLRRHLVINARGILDRRLGLGWILWEEIEGAYPMRRGTKDGLCLQVRVTDRLARNSDRICGKPVHGRIEVPLDLDGASMSGVEVLQCLVRHGG